MKQDSEIPQVRLRPKGLPKSLLAIEAELWRKMKAKFDDQKFDGVRVLGLGFEQDERTSLRNGLRFIGVKATAIAPSVAQLKSVPAMGLAFTHVVVNIDAYESVEDAVAALIDFRIQSPITTVIAVSARVADDDFGTDRNAICDVTLRLPLTERRIRRSLIEGRTNRLSSVSSPPTSLRLF
jgi:hypothetical protein